MVNKVRWRSPNCRNETMNFGREDWDSCRSLHGIHWQGLHYGSNIFLLETDVGASRSGCWALLVCSA